jgi:leucyl-tRNA synthetase
VWTGAFALNPVNGERIPIWIADYVLLGYGTGAIMAVPAHDERDWEFARKFALPIREVVSATPRVSVGHKAACESEPLECLAGEGFAVNSGPLDGLPTADAKAEISRLLEAQGLGKKTVNYKLRDWLFSRQRYWGEPFPIVWEDGQHRAIPANELPLTPPEMTDFKPTGTSEPPLAKATDWLRYSDKATRETNTMPQWAGSCWYYLRYCDARNAERFVGADAERYWMGGGQPGGVDLYVGGTEHAVLHLLYARFWHKVLFDLGHVSTPEPFQRLVNQGLILGETEYSLFEIPEPDGLRCSVADLRDIEEEATPAGRRLVGYHRVTGEKYYGHNISSYLAVEKVGDAFVLKEDPSIRLDARSFKMSKSRGNVVNPDDVIAEYGADALRGYLMFMGPLEATKPWSMSGVEGITRFLARVWRLVMEEQQDGSWALGPVSAEAAPDKAQLRVLHASIKKLTADIEALSFNTALAQLMVCTNAFVNVSPRPLSAVRTLLTLLNPFAPHLTEELWENLAQHFGDTPGQLADVPWPAWDERLLIDDEIEIVIQVNGKVRDKLVVPKDAGKDQVEAAARASAKIAEWTAGKEIKKVVVVPGKLVNIVVA